MPTLFRGFLSGLFLLFSLNISAKSPVAWTYKVKKTAVGEYDLIFTAHIDKGVHMYSQHIGTEGPVPTSFTFDKSAQYALIDSVKEVSKAIRMHDDIFDMELIYFEDVAEFVQHVKVKGELKNISGNLEFMCCNGKMCFPPQKVDFTFDLTK